MREFAEKGFAGGRINSIAASAKVNKERIYQYFGDKDGLFDAALARELDFLAEAVPMASSGPADLVDYVRRSVDHFASRPHLARLLYWEGLERETARAATSERTARYQTKVDAVLDALAEQGHDRATAASILFAIITLATSTHALPQLTQMILGDQTGRERAALTTLATLLVRDHSAD